MKHKIVRAFVLALSVVGLSVSLHAQVLIQDRLGLSAGPLDSQSSPDVMLQVAEAKVSAGVFDTAAESLLRGAEKFTRCIFNVPSLQFQRAVTQRVYTGAKRGDVLIAEWSFHEKFGEGLIVLTDTPYYSNYELQVRNGRINSRADLTAFLSSALLPEKIRGSASEKATALLTPTAVYVPAGAPTVTFFAGETPSASPYEFVADFKFSGLLVGKEWFLDFGVGKSGTKELYGIAPFVPERFPPLGDLAKSWSFAQIREEVGSSVKPFEAGPDFTGNRDKILIAELARRGLSTDQVLDLLTDVQATAKSYEQRLASIDDGFHEAKGSFIKLFFKPALETYEQIGPVASSSVLKLFNQAAIEGCSSNIEASALDVLKKGVFPDGPLAYLRRCSTSRETLATLQAMSLPTEKLEKQKELTLSAIRRNIELPTKRHNTAGGGK